MDPFVSQSLASATLSSILAVSVTRSVNKNIFEPRPSVRNRVLDEPPARATLLVDSIQDPPANVETVLT